MAVVWQQAPRRGAELKAGLYAVLRVEIRAPRHFCSGPRPAATADGADPRPPPPSLGASWRRQAATLTGRAAGGAGGGSWVWARSCGRCQGKHVFASQRKSRDPGRTPSCWYYRRVPSLRSFSYGLRGGPWGGPGRRRWKNGEAPRGAPRPATGQHPPGAGHRCPLQCLGPAGSPQRGVGGWEAAARPAAKGSGST